jgi:copper chaperone NosL
MGGASAPLFYTPAFSRMHPAHVGVSALHTGQRSIHDEYHESPAHRSYPPSRPANIFDRKPKVMMKNASRWLVIAASLAMIPALFLPLWDIQLDAPQYPEGLGMQIWLDHLAGDVKTISNLNHYIGMKAIDDSMFPELAYMKYVIVFFIVTGLAVALWRNKRVFAGWFILFFATAAYGIYDFWQWEYDYGHNLDPHAAIIVPGMAYQPPLLGCEQLLNFNACSYPALGGAIIMSAGTLCFLVFLNEFFLKKRKAPAVRPLATPSPQPVAAG